MIELRSEAWLLRGISSIPGELRLEEGRLVFEAWNTGTAWPWQLRKLERELGAPGFADAIENGRPCRLFDWPVADLIAWCPWYYFGGGIKLRRNGLTLRFSFGRPANTRINAHGTPAAAGQAMENLGELAVMRSRGKQWIAALARPA